MTIAVLDVDGGSVLLVSDDDVVEGREQRDASEHGDVPVHRLRRRASGGGEEAEHEEAEEEADGDDVDRHAPLAEREARGREGLAAEALAEEAANGKEVGGEKRGHGQRRDGVEGSCRAEVEESD